MDRFYKIYITCTLIDLMNHVRDRAWFVCLYGEIIPELYSEVIIDRKGSQIMLYLTCTMISSLDLAHYAISRAKNWVSVDCGTIEFIV